MTAASTFACEVREGKLVPDDPVAWKGWLLRHAGKRVTVEIELEQPRRSVRANARYWSMLVPLAADVLSIGRVVPLSSKQAHDVLKQVFLGYDRVTGPHGVEALVLKSTAATDTPEFAAYCEKIQAWLAQDHGVRVPEPGEAWEGE